MRIGTWNLEGRWSEQHHVLITSLRCDLLLLTEMPSTVRLSGMTIHTTSTTMAPGRRWSAVASRDVLVPAVDPHGATAQATVAGIVVCSSVLPWRSCGSDAP